MTAIIEAIGLVRTFRTDRGDVVAVDGLDLTVSAGEVVAVTGPSGAGKSTLLSLLAGLDHPTAGQVLLDGRNVFALEEADISQLRSRRLGVIFQDLMLFDELTAAENVEFPLRIQRRGADERSRMVDAALAGVELSPYAGQRPEELSGGQQQRVAVARALITGPGIVLADEPTAQLDSRTAALVTGHILSVARERNGCVVVATHDQDLMLRADRVLRLRAGRWE